jgi:hypothetical protein
MLTCKQCKQLKDESQFRKTTRKGIVSYRAKCKECSAAVKYKRSTKIREWFEEYKKGCICNHCNLSDHRVLEFHHINGNKKYAITDIVSGEYSKKSILAELAKCIPLCANCHRILHYEARHAVMV